MECFKVFIGQLPSLFNMPPVKKGQKKKGRKTIPEKILEELHKGTPYKEIREEYKSQSGLYDALTIFFPEAETKYSEKISEIQGLNARIKALEDKVKNLKRETIQFTEDGRTLENSVLERTGQLRTIEKDIEDREKARAQLKILDDKGVSIQLIKSISTMDVKNSKDLLTRMKTVEAYNQENQKYKNLVTKS